MRTTRVWIHLRSCCGSRLSSSLHQREYLTRWPNRPLTEAFHKQPSSLILPDLERGSLMFQQIGNYIVVDLEIASSDHEGTFRVTLVLNEPKYLFHCTWYYSSLRISPTVTKSFHCMRFAGSSLSVSQKCGIIAFKCAEYCFLSSVRVHFSLSSIYVINPIKWESVLLN